MKRSEFNSLVEYRIEKIREVLASKASEYATDGSAFYNFERASEIERRKPKQCLWSMASKHLVSVIDMVESDVDFDPEYIDEKIGDMINYLILLEGMLKDSSLCCGEWNEYGECTCPKATRNNEAQPRNRHHTALSVPLSTLHE